MSPRLEREENPACFLAAHGHLEKGGALPPCEGLLVRCHLIDQQELNRRGLEVGDPATYVAGCGGLTGLGGHHGMFDGGSPNKLRLRFADLPPNTVRFAEEHGLVPWLERKYGPR